MAEQGGRGPYDPLDDEVFPPCPEGRGDCLNDFVVLVSTRYGSLVPQAVHAANLQETFQKVLALPITAWFPPEGFDLPRPSHCGATVEHGEHNHDRRGLTFRCLGGDGGLWPPSGSAREESS